MLHTEFEYKFYKWYIQGVYYLVARWKTAIPWCLLDCYYALYVQNCTEPAVMQQGDFHNGILLVFSGLVTIIYLFIMITNNQLTITFSTMATERLWQVIITQIMP